METKDKDMNVFQYSAIVEANWKRNLANMGDYKSKYTFYADFAIAEFCETFMHDKNAVKKTFNQVIKSWGTNIEAMTEIVMVTNHKVWAFYDRVDSHYMGVGDEVAIHYSKLYQELYEKAVEFIEKNFGNNEGAMSYYYRVTD